MPTKPKPQRVRLSSIQDYARLPARQRETLHKAFNVLSDCRTTGKCLSEAAKDNRIDLRSVHKYVESALTKSGSRLAVKSYDRIPRLMTVVTTSGKRDVLIRDSRTASKVGQHSSAVKAYLETGDTMHLKSLGNIKFRSGKLWYVLETDVEALKHLGHAGELNLERIYANLDS